jgi:4-diphosphocytidyl-2-C-methyl-D-erythritol kinase
MLDELGVTADVEVRVTKHIPWGAGLGGGSSDAAAVLRTLPVVLGRHLRPVRLAELALRIGTDVPFFLTCRPSVAMGVGEILAAVPRFPELHLVVAVPAVQVSTAWAYGHAVPANGTLTSHPSATTRSLRLRLKREPLAALLSNDLEPGVMAAFPEVTRVKRRLEELGAEAAVMSGSGSAVVGLFRSGRRAEEAAAAVRSPVRAYAVRVLRRRPAVVGAAT